jgi:pilus assembly protein Flp/PilA
MPTHHTTCSVPIRYKNQKGQGLIEYLILVAIISVATIGIVRVVGANVAVQFANVAKALGSGDDNQLKAEKIEADMYSKKDLSNFLNGAAKTNRLNPGGNK